MFNWPFKLRRQTDFISPVGPNFNSAPWKMLNISGTQIKIKIPQLRTTFPVESFDTNHPCEISQLQGTLQERNSIRLRSCALIYRVWDFYGPWFTGKMGRIHMQAMIVSPADITDGLNYYHPRALEAGISDYLTHFYDDDFWSDGSQTWLAPMNWQPCTDLPCLAVRFNASRSRLTSTGPNFYFVMPVSKHHLLFIDCDISRNNVFSSKKPEPTVDEWINLTPFLELANQVLASVQVTLSPQAQADQAEALSDLEDKSLIKEFPPIKWTEKPRNN